MASTSDTTGMIATMNNTSVSLLPPPLCPFCVIFNNYFNIIEFELLGKQDASRLPFGFLEKFAFSSNRRELLNPSINIENEKKVKKQMILKWVIMIIVLKIYKIIQN